MTRKNKKKEDKKASKHVAQNEPASDEEPTADSVDSEV